MSLCGAVGAMGQSCRPSAPPILVGGGLWGSPPSCIEPNSDVSVWGCGRYGAELPSFCPPDTGWGLGGRYGAAPPHTLNPILTPVYGTVGAMGQRCHPSAPLMLVGGVYGAAPLALSPILTPVCGAVGAMGQCHPASDPPRSWLGGVYGAAPLPIFA